MDDMSFLNLPKKDDQKWNSAIMLAKSEDYGGAVSLLIISIEELIKSIILFMDGKGFEFRNVKGINTFFRNHQIRYIIAFVMFAMNIIGEDLVKFILKIRENPN